MKRVIGILAVLCALVSGPVTGVAIAAAPSAAAIQTVPPAPTILSPVNGAITSDATPQIQGTAQANALVTVRIDNVEVDVVTASGDGSWTYEVTAPLSDGLHTVDARAEDAEGDVGPFSTPVTFEVDTTPPTPPSVSSPTAGQITGPRPTITGQADPTTTVTVSVDNVPVGSTAAGPEGDWSFTVASDLAPGERFVAGQAADAVGNTSAPGSAVTFVVAAQPTVSSLSATSGSTAGGLTVILTGQHFASTTGVTFGGTSATFVVVDAQTLHVVTPARPAGQVPVQVTTLGGVSSGGPDFLYVAPQDLPATPVIQIPADGSTTADLTPRVAGTSAPGATIELHLDGNRVQITSADGSGAWDTDLTTSIAEGSRSLFVVAISGGAGVPSPSIAFTADATPPPTPVILSPANAAVVPRRPTVTGTAEPLATVALRVDDVPIGSTSAGSDGAWTFTPSSGLTPGERVVTARAIDAAGSPSNMTASVTVTVTTDTTAQTITFLQPPDVDVSAGTVTLSAQASSGLPVSFTSDTPSVCQVSSAGVVTLLAGGTCTITVSQAGDTEWSAAPSVARSFTVTAPSVPEPIPTLSEWMMALLALALAGLALAARPLRLAR